MKKPNMVFKPYVLVVVLFFSVIAQGQVDGDYQTLASGNWNGNSTWQVRSGGAWVNCVAGDYPGAAVGAGTVNILSGNTVTLTASPANPIGALTFAPGNIALSSVVFGGAWTLNISGAVTYTLPGANNNGDQTLSVGTGTLNCASVTMVTTTDNLRIQTLSLSTGNINVTGNVTMATATQNAITFTGAGTLNIGGGFTPGTGTFTPATGTVNYNGANQNVASLIYNNLTISGTNNKTLQGNITVNSNLNVSSGTLDFGNTVIRTVTVTGNLSGAGTIDMASGGSLAHQLTLNGTNNAIGSFVCGSGTVIYSRAGIQQIFAGTYYNLTTQTSNQIRTIQGDVIINNNLTITLGTLNFGNVAARNVVVNGNLSGAGTIDMSGGALAHVLTLNGPNNAITTLTPGSGTVIYSGAVAQQIFAGTYYNLANQTSNQVRTIQGNVTVNNDLTITLGTFSFGNVIRTVSVSGNLNGAGTIDMSGGPVAHVLNLGGVNNAIGTLTTAAAASVINYNRPGDQFVFASPNYRNLTISVSGNKTMQGNVSVGGTATFNTAGCALDINGNTLFLNNSTTGTNGTITGGLTSNLVITGNATPAMILPAVTGGLNNFTINKTGATNTVTLGGNLDVNGTLTLTAGALSIAANTLTLSDAGTLSYGAGSLTGGVTSNLTIGTGADITLNAIAGGLNNFTTSRNITLGAALSVNGTLTLTAGNFTVGANTLTLNGPTIAGTPTNLITVPGSSLVFGGTTAGVLIPTSVVALTGLSITNTNIVTLQSSLTLSGLFNPGGAGLSIGANTLTLNGQINCGTLVGGPTSNIIINASGLPANLSGVTLNNLTINRAVTMCGNVTVGGTLTLTAGALSIAANTLTLSDAGTLSYGAGSLTGGVTSNLTIGTGADITLNAIAGGLNNFTTSRNIILGADLSL